jgi:hypothetical protein
MTNLIPELHMDKNGHLVTRHVRAGSPATSAGTFVPPPVIPKQTEMRLLADQFKGFESDSYMRDELGFAPEYDKLLANLENLSDLELSRFALYLNHSEEETVAFLMALDKEKYDLLSDMTLIYDRERHSGMGIDPDDEYQEFMPSPEDLYLAVVGDHEGMKHYMKSQGVSYTKLDALSNKDRALALKWLEAKYACKNMIGALVFEYGRDERTGEADFGKSFMKFADPELLELAMNEPRFLELAKAHDTSDTERLKMMLAHEASVSGGVL